MFIRISTVRGFSISEMYPKRRKISDAIARIIVRGVRIGDFKSHKNLDLLYLYFSCNIVFASVMH